MDAALRALQLRFLERRRRLATSSHPQFPYPNHNLGPSQLTVTSSRGPTATDNVKITVNWGFFDDFSTDKTADYPVTVTFGTFGTFR